MRVGMLEIMFGIAKRPFIRVSASSGMMIRLLSW